MTASKNDQTPVFVATCGHCRYECEYTRPNMLTECPRCARTDIRDRVIAKPHQKTWDKAVANTKVAG